MLDEIQEYNKALEQTIVTERFQHIKRAKLDVTYDDLPLQIVQLTITDSNGVKWYFKFFEASVVEEAVRHSDDQCYLPLPYEIIVLVDETSPKRMLRAAERFFRDYRDEERPGDICPGLAVARGFPSPCSKEDIERSSSHRKS